MMQEYESKDFQLEYTKRQVHRPKFLLILYCFKIPFVKK